MQHGSEVTVSGIEQETATASGQEKNNREINMQDCQALGVKVWGEGNTAAGVAMIIVSQ